MAKDPAGREVRRGVGGDRQGHRTRGPDGAGDDLVRSENKYYSDLFGIARRILVHGVGEREKPDAERYRDFSPTPWAPGD